MTFIQRADSSLWLNVHFHWMERKAKREDGVLCLLGKWLNVGVFEDGAVNASKFQPLADGKAVIGVAFVAHRRSPSVRRPC